MEIEMTDIASFRASYTAERTAEINERADAISALQPGDGITVSVWTEADAYTIVRVTPTRITARMDAAKLSEGWKPEFIVGGFAGHCVNQSEQTYDYQPDPNGALVTVTLRRWKDEEGNERRAWKQAGTGTRERGGSVRAGRHKFHDYNF
jgi:hypothetical protein